MKADHGRTVALLVGRCLCALALAHVSLSVYAVNKNNIGRIGQASNGRSTTLSPPTNSGGSTLPISPNIGGWSQAGNYGVPPGASGTTMNLTGSGQAIFSGTKYPFQAGYQQPKSSWVLPALGAAAAIGCTFASGGLATVACLGLPAAMPFLYEWMTRSGARINPQSGGLERRPEGCNGSTCEKFRPEHEPTYSHWSFSSACEAGQAYVMAQQAATFEFRNQSSAGGVCSAERRTIGPPPGGWSAVAFTVFRTTVADTGQWIPASMDDIAPYMVNTVPDGRVWGEALEKGAEFPLPNPTVTGPSQIQGPEKTTTNPDGSRTVERTTYNFQTAGNTINNTSNVTTTTTYNTDNSVRNTSTTTTTPTDEERDPEDPCEKRPNSIGCQELEDPPKTEIPKETKTITYAEEAGIGGGSCPADVMWSPQSIAGTYKFIDWQQACGWALQLKWIVILLATWAAFWIVMPGNTQVKPQ